MSDDDGRSDDRRSREPEDRRDAALRRVRRFVATYVEKGKYELYPEPAVVENVVQGLADNLVTHGRRYCPCAPVEESMAKGSEMVCPCKPHHADIARQGYCDCALFASSEFVAAERAKLRPHGPSDAHEDIEPASSAAPTDAGRTSSRSAIE
ncbi:MAG: hypothetical protein BGO98_10545 [Myxococcales bacterium 68-20]|nr:hypothetical protein [Myxococcales bacterium]OJY18082.1 MAG: hypothetical protein BGO98_10545 [Myxococcales bacterium 68-20]